MAKRTQSAHAADFPTLFTEMALAAPHVVAHRLARMALAGPTPSARDQREFQQMGMEKVFAFYESWQAMALQSMYFNQQLAWNMMTTFWFPWTATSSLQKLPEQINQATQDILEKGIEPVHRRAVANAKRLGRTRLK